MRFENQVVIVTGGASGIGLATAKRFASEGASVVIADLDPTRLDPARQSVVEAGAPRALAQRCDVALESDVAGLIDSSIQSFGRLDVVVNNAGLMIFKPIVEITSEDWDKVLGVDLLGAFYFIKHAFLQMKSDGTIVNVASVHAIETTPLVASYAAAKAALLSLTRSAAIEGRARGIRVNAVLPGAVDTPMLWSNPNIKSGVEHIDAEDVGKPEDIAAAIAYLASPDARFITGASLAVDGGRLARL